VFQIPLADRLAVEASFNSVDQYALRPDVAGTRHGVGLSFGANEGLGQLSTRSWNVDVFTSWTFYRALALYGRVGYGQSETLPSSVSFRLAPIAGAREGVNVGGAGYDMNSSFDGASSALRPVRRRNRDEPARYRSGQLRRPTALLTGGDSCREPRHTA
jgi:hypothetical protein